MERLTVISPRKLFLNLIQYVLDQLISILQFILQSVLTNYEHQVNITTIFLNQIEEIVFLILAIIGFLNRIKAFGKLMDGWTKKIHCVRLLHLCLGASKVWR